MQDDPASMKNEGSGLFLPFLGRRIAVAREASGLTQSELAAKLGFRDRQTLSAIESGERKVAIEEMIALAQHTGRDLDFFTDPFQLVGEGGFSYRATGISETQIEPFEQAVGKWLALWRYLGERRGELPGPIRPKLALNKDSTFEAAQSAGEAMAVYLGLGTAPGERLAEAVEQKLIIPVLFVDMPAGISGVAAQIINGEAILINRQESLGRQTFDLAHELFHILTWDAMPPERVDRRNPSNYKAKKVEQLADNFAAALLMPSGDIASKWERKDEASSLEDWIVSAANLYRVSPPAVLWRLVALGKLKKTEAKELITRLPSFPIQEKTPFSRTFFERLSWGLERGEVSVRKSLKILGVDLNTAKELASLHGVALNIGM
jgi:Zn-dependent peptidase ImmA (M78 family)/DNA-binding XRE family transcriptional regulator